jgi:WD40 repeat protein
VFAPAGSLIKAFFKEEEPDWIRTKSAVEADWNACLQTLEGHNHSVRSVVFSPDGQRLASGSDDETVKIWDAMSGHYLQTLEGHNDSVRSVAFSPDGQRLASGSDDKTVKIWDATSGHCLQTLEGHNNWVQSIAFSPDGQRLASGSDNKTVKIWDATSGHCLQTLKGHGLSVQSVAFSPEGQRLASGSDDETVKIWDATSGHCLQTFVTGCETTRISFDYTDRYLLTDTGCIKVTTAANKSSIEPHIPGRHSYGLRQDWTWITCNDQNVLWLQGANKLLVDAVKWRHEGFYVLGAHLPSGYSNSHLTREQVSKSG